MLRGTAISQQLASAGLIATCLSLQLAGTVHLMVVEHELCVEHGEAVDVAGAGHAHGHAGSRTDRGAAEIHAGSGPSGHGAAAHGHCLLVEDRAGRALVVEAALEGMPAPGLLAITAAQSTSWGLSPAALRLLAPKTSPPV